MKKPEEENLVASIYYKILEGKCCTLFRFRNIPNEVHFVRILHSFMVAYIDEVVSSGNLPEKERETFEAYLIDSLNKAYNSNSLESEPTISADDFNNLK